MAESQFGLDVFLIIILVGTIAGAVIFFKRLQQKFNATLLQERLLYLEKAQKEKTQNEKMQHEKAQTEKAQNAIVLSSSEKLQIAIKSLSRLINEITAKYKSAAGRDKLNFIESDPDEIQLLVIRARFLEFERKALAKKFSSKEHFTALKSLLSRYAKTINQSRLGSIQKTIRTLQAKIKAQQVRLENLHEVEATSTEAQVALNKAKGLISRIRLVNESLLDSNTDDYTLASIKAEMIAIEEGCANKPEDYQSVHALINEDDEFELDLVSPKKRSSKELSTEKQGISSQESVADKSLTLLDKELEYLIYIAEEQRQKINELNRQLNAKAGTMPDEEINLIIERISKLEAELSESENQVKALESEINTLTKELKQFTTNNEHDTGLHETHKTLHEEDQEFEDPNQTENSFEETVSESTGSPVIVNATNTESAAQYHLIFQENEALKASALHQQMQMNDLNTTINTLQEDKDKIESSLNVLSDINTANARAVKFLKELSTAHKTEDVANCLINYARAWQVIVHVLIRGINGLASFSSEGSFTAEDRSLIENRDAPKNVYEVDNKIVIRNELIALVLHRNDTEKQSNLLLDAWVAQTGVADKHARRLQVEWLSTGEKQSLIEAAKKATENLAVNIQYQKNEREKILNEFLKTLNNITMNNVMEDQQLPVEQLRLLKETAERSKSRLDLLAKSHGLLDQPFKELIRRME